MPDHSVTVSGRTIMVREAGASDGRGHRPLPSGIEPRPPYFARCAALIRGSMTA